MYRSLPSCLLGIPFIPWQLSGVVLLPCLGGSQADALLFLCICRLPWIEKLHPTFFCIMHSGYDQLEHVEYYFCTVMSFLVRSQVFRRELQHPSVLREYCGAAGGVILQSHCACYTISPILPCSWLKQNKCLIAVCLWLDFLLNKIWPIMPEKKCGCLCQAGLVRQGAQMECSTKGQFGGCYAIPGVSLPFRFLVVRRAAVAPRAIDQPSCGVGHRLPSDSDRRHCNNLDNRHGSFDAKRNVVEEWPKDCFCLNLFLQARELLSLCDFC